MEANEMSGSWWLPEAPDNKFWGVLSCSESGELSLKVAGHLTGEWVGETERNVSTIILGETYGDQGQAVTLRRCFKTNHTVSSNPLSNSQEFFAQRGYFGSHLPSPAEPFFETATLTYSGLASWTQNFTGLVSGPTPYSVDWVEPHTRSATIPGCIFELGTGISHTNAGRMRTLTESVVLRCVFDPAITEAEFQSRVAYGFQGLLTFATGRPNALSHLRVSGPPAISESTRVVGPAVYTDETEASDLTNSDMLFSLGDVADRFEDVVYRWFALSDRYSKVLPLYFGGIYRPPGYTDLRFVQVLQALTLYQTQRDADLGRPTAADRFVAAFPVEMSGEGFVHLKELINSHPRAGSEHALISLAAEHATEFAPVIGGVSKVAEFVQYVSNTQQYLLTRRVPTTGRALEGGDLYWMTERLAWLFKIILLKELGFSPNHIHELTARNVSFNYAKLQAQDHSELRP